MEIGQPNKRLIGSTGDFDPGIDLDPNKFIKAQRKALAQMRKPGKKVIASPGIPERIKKMVKIEIRNQKNLIDVMESSGNRQIK